MSQQRIETICVQGGYTPGNGEPRQIPIIQSTTFKYATSEDMGKLFDLEASGYFYTRLQNPTNDHVAAKIAALEGGTAAMLTASGSAATFFAIRPITTTSSPSYSVRSERAAGRTIVSPGPITAVFGFRNNSGSAGATPPISAAWS